MMVISCPYCSWSKEFEDWAVGSVVRDLHVFAEHPEEAKKTLEEAKKRFGVEDNETQEDYSF